MMADCSSMESLLSSTIPPLIANGITVTITCILLAFFDWRLALCVFCTVPIAFLIIWLSRKRQIRLFEKQVDAKLKASDQVQEYLEGMKIIKFCGLRGSRFKTLDHALLAMKKIAVKVEMAVGVFMSGASMVLQAGIGITIFVGAILLTSGQIELIPLLMFLLMVTRIYGPILSILANLSSLLNLNVVTNRMRTLLITPAMAGEEKTLDNCDIELSHVTFAYNQDDVIRDVSCKIPQGSVTALVGPSGSGKTTICSLLPRFYDVTGGRITIDGKDVRTLTLKSLRSQIGMVQQDVYLFSGTIRENIAYGKPGASEEEIMEAARRANIHEFISELPDGYDTFVGERGARLSGGQKQRVAIAGVMAMQPKCIIMDEPTAMLDPNGRKEVLEAVHELNRREGITVILITHYMEEVIDSDRVFVMDQGHVVMQGTPREIFSRVEELKAYRLDVPQVTLLAYELKKAGIPLPEGILTTKELVDALCH